jgi:hypothetical protein
VIKKALLPQRFVSLVLKRVQEELKADLSPFGIRDRELAVRTYDGMIGTFTTNGKVDEETQKNDLDIVREVLNVTKEVPIERAYDFSFAKKADSELTQARNLRNFYGWDLASVRTMAEI